MRKSVERRSCMYKMSLNDSIGESGVVCSIRAGERRVSDCHRRVIARNACLCTEIWKPVMIQEYGSPCLDDGRQD